MYTLMDCYKKYAKKLVLEKVLTEHYVMYTTVSILSIAHTPRIPICLHLYSLTRL
jgi:hypothetical protein